MAFECPHCHTRNSEVQNASVIMERGVIQTCRVDAKEDLNRQIVKSDMAKIKFVELDLEIPSTGKGFLTTIEGLVTNVIDDLSAQQPIRMVTNETLYNQLEVVIDKLKGYVE